MEYTTYTGEKKQLDQIDQQHLSNIYWFNRVIWNRDDNYLSHILEQINTRFEGKILPYIPQWQFTQEIEILDKTGKFIWDQDRTEADIIYAGHIIGHYITPQKLREDKISEII